MAESDKTTLRNQMCASLRDKRFNIQAEVISKRLTIPNRINENLNTAIASAQVHERKCSEKQKARLDKEVRAAIALAEAREKVPAYPAVVRFDDPPDEDDSLDGQTILRPQIVVKSGGKRSMSADKTIRTVQKKMDLMQQEVFRKFAKPANGSFNQTINRSVDL